MNTTDHKYVRRWRSITLLATLLACCFAATAASAQAPIPPSGVRAILDTTEFTITLDWNPVANADSYAVQRRQYPSGTWLPVTANVTGTNWTDENVGPGQFYTYRVRAVNAHGNSGFSGESNIATPPTGTNQGYTLEWRNLILQTGDGTVTSGAEVIAGSPLSGRFEGRISNPVNVFAQHRIAIGFRNETGEAVGSVFEVSGLGGNPRTPTQWVTSIPVPTGLRMPATPGNYTLWIESTIGGTDPRMAFQTARRTQSSSMAKPLIALESTLPTGDQAFFAIGNAEAKPSELLSVPIFIGAIGGENAFSFTLEYDPDTFQFIRFSASGDLRRSDIRLNTNTPGKIGVLMLMPVETSLQPGLQEFATLRFSLKGQIEPGSQFPLIFTDSIVDRMILDNEINFLPHGWRDGSASITATGWEGDVWPIGAPDGVIDDKDYDHVMELASGNVEPLSQDEFQRADCFPMATAGNGRIQIPDAMLTRAFARGTFPWVPVGGPHGPAGANPLATMPLAPLFTFSWDPLLPTSENSPALSIEGSDTADPDSTWSATVSLEQADAIELVSFSLRWNPDRMQLLELEATNSVDPNFISINLSRRHEGLAGVILQSSNEDGFRISLTELLHLSFSIVDISEGTDLTLTFDDEIVSVQAVGDTLDAIIPTTSGVSLVINPKDTTQLAGAVGNLQVQAQSDTAILLDWTPGAGATAHHIYRRTATEAWGLLAEVPAGADSYLDLDLQPATAYSYRIASIHANGINSSTPIVGTTLSTYRHWASLNIPAGLPSDPTDDADGDGMINYLEFLIGTDPATPDPASRQPQLAFADIYGFGQQHMLLVLDVRADAPLEQFTAQGSLNLQDDWQDLVLLEPESLPNGLLRLKYRSAESFTDYPSQFMRLKMQLHP